MTRTILMVLVGAMVAGFVGAASAEDKKPSVISEAMIKFHKGKEATCGKIVGGQATDEEIKGALAAYEAMAAAKPPKGDADSWKAKTGALIDAVKLIQAKDASGAAKYKAAVDCKACHSVHKG